MRKSIGLLLVVSLFGCGEKGDQAKVPPLPSLNRPTMNKDEMLNRVNAARASGYRCGDEDFPSVPALVWHPLLEKAAAGHAQDMHEKNYFAHEALDGSHPSDRVTRAGYRWTAVGENIAKGQSTIEEVVQGWLHSPGHCKNIMNRMFTQLGASHFVSTWVQNFGHP